MTERDDRTEWQLEHGLERQLQALERIADALERIAQTVAPTRSVDDGAGE